MGRYLRTAAVVIFIFAAGIVIRYWSGPVRTGTCGYKVRLMEPLSACVGMDGGMYSRSGFFAGFQYMMLSGFADTCGIDVDICSSHECGDYWSMLSDSLLDIVAVSLSDSVFRQFEDSVAVSIPFDGYAWAVRKNDTCLLQWINFWLGLYTRGDAYDELRYRFVMPYNLKAGLGKAGLTDRISPYDESVKLYSRYLGWDWRLLSALIFKESRFSLNAYSRRGAVGLMQVMHSTALSYGISDLFDPEENIKAGTMHLFRIQQRYRERGLDSVNVVKFTLAAYNAGESRIEDCINFTKDHGRDCTDWETVAATIPLMADIDGIEGADYLRHGRFSGQETVRYVSDVLSIYEKYLTSVP